MSWRHKEAEPVYGVIVDVLSGSVGFSLVYSDPDDPIPEVIYSHREYIKIGTATDTPSMIRALRHTLFASALQFSEEGMVKLRVRDKHARVEKVLLVCGAPWAHTATRLIHTEEKEPFVVTKERVSALVKAAETRDEEELRRSDLLRELNITLVEHAIVHTAVNGYLVADPYGVKAKELSLSHISGLIPQVLTDTIVEIEGKVMPHATRTSHTFALVLFCVLRDLYAQSKNALIIDISGEATELIVVQDEVLMETQIFPHGGYTSLRELAAELKTVPEEALAHIRDMNANTPEHITRAAQAAGEQYVILLKEALVSLGERFVIPKQMFLITGRGVENFFKGHVMRATEGYRGAHGTLTCLNEELFKETPANQKGKPDSRDAFVNIEARFFHKLHGCGDLG